MKPALSICLPTYCQVPHSLWQALHKQALALAVPCEITVLEDGSPEQYWVANQKFCEKLGLTHRVLPQNTGRAAARNALAKMAQGDYLLFLDGDAQMEDPHWLEKYWQTRLPQGVAVGGRAVDAAPRPGCELRWAYAQKREVRSLAQRQKAPYASFKTNAFLAHRSVFARVQFDESLRHYGHEDSLFGLALAAAKIPLRHFEAPLLHPAEDSNADFLHKTEQSLSNVLHIVWRYPQYAHHFALYRRARQLQQLGLAPAVRAVAQMSNSALQKQLRSARPSLALFDFWRLARLLHLMNQNT